MLHFLPANTRYIIAGAIILIVLAIRGYQFLSSGRKPTSDLPLGASRNYGIAGGAICPQCQRPFPLPVFAIKLGFGTKFARCEFCGKWSLVHRASLDELRAAEAAELANAQAAQPLAQKSEAERLKDLVDNSRFTDREA